MESVISPHKAPKHPPQIWQVREPSFPALPSVDASVDHGAAQSGHDKPAIVIDNGSSMTRAGWSFDTSPRLIFPPVISKYRDRKLSRTYLLVGQDAYCDATARGQIKAAFEPGNGIVSNWDVMENVLDYVFLKLGLDGAEGGIDRPVVMTEPVANLGYPRKVMTEVMFECYSAPSLAYGIDSLFAYRQNEGNTGLVVSSSRSATHLVPVIDQKPVLALATRLNWGGYHNSDFLLKLLQLKYPTFPGKMTLTQADELVRQHCSVAQDYQAELSHFLDWTGLEDRDHVIQYPFTEQVVIQKSEEELAKIAEKRKESGRRLQQQAAKMRLEKLVKKEQELEYYRQIQQKGTNGTKKNFKQLLEGCDMETEAQLEKAIKELEKSIRKARTKDVGGAEDDTEVVPSFPLLDIPDEELDDAAVKQKRQQRLAKANVDARARAKAEKETENARMAEKKRLDDEMRENDLDEWVRQRRAAREQVLHKMKDRQRLKADLGNRKSLASQMRMKRIANLASDHPSSKKRRRGGDDDTFGANDDDWGVYRTIVVKEPSDEEEEEDLVGGLQSLEADLLQHDPTFLEEHTHSAQTDWTKSLVHAFLRGPWPFDASSTAEAHQIHLNVERIRVPEVVFQPSIAGLDQAGLVEIANDIIQNRLSSVSSSSAAVLKDIFLTGGNTLLPGFDTRLTTELIAVSPADAPLLVRRAKDPLLDAWRGAARWVGSDEWKEATVSREEYLEKGSEYIKEHHLGNSPSS